MAKKKTTKTGRKNRTIKEPIKKTQKLKDRFMSNIKKQKSCWLWQGAFTTDGYGQIWLAADRVEKAHRLAHELFKKRLEPKRRLRNNCGNDVCVNPDHWDIIIKKVYIPKGRAHLVGENNGNSNLSATDIKKIRDLAGKKTHPEIAKMFKISSGQVGRIIRRKNWSHVK